jgi:hypothetical protein
MTQVILPSADLVAGGLFYYDSPADDQVSRIDPPASMWRISNTAA